MTTTILLGLVSIGILILVHELGHFVAARASGIRVEVFSIGWGKGIISFPWGETRIQIGWIPFGGYCKMAGDSPKDELKGKSYEYYSSSPWKRIAVALSGPLFNYLFAILLFSLIIVVGYEIHTYSNKIVLAKGDDFTLYGERTPAQESGLKDGDVIVGIDGDRVRNWDDITEHIVRKALKTVNIAYRREGKVYTTTTIPAIDRETGRGLIGIHPWVEPVIGKVLPGEPAERAGLREDDRILMVNGKRIHHHVDFYNAIEETGNEEVLIMVERDGKQMSVSVTPSRVEGTVSAGILFRQLTYRSERYPFLMAIGKGFLKSTSAVRDTIRGIVFVFSGKIRARSAVAGPAKLIYISGVIAKEGVVYFFQIMSYISIAFFIMNLIPFPALDGSHIALSFYEIIMRRRPRLEVIYTIQAFGFMVLIVLLIFVTMNDISSFFGR